MKRTFHALLSLGAVVLLSIACDLEDTNGSSNIGPPPAPPVEEELWCDDIRLSDYEAALYEMVMQERERQGLPIIPLSASLTYVAQTHADDMLEFPDTASGQCSLHSWTNTPYWQGCCYTPDHSKVECMHSKPEELTGFPSTGYEIAYRGTGNVSDIFNAWQSSEQHSDVIFNRNDWNTQRWRSIGVGISDYSTENERFAYIWFATRKECE